MNQNSNKPQEYVVNPVKSDDEKLMDDVAKELKKKEIGPKEEAEKSRKGD